jgi:hypothetical protein
MDTLTFLDKVLPDQGVYVGAQLTQMGMRHRFFDTTDDLAQWALATSAKGGNVYYTVSSMLEATDRTQENTRVTKLVAVDVDCGPKKPYPSWKEGLLAISDFVTATGLPKPTVVHSGNGLHVYWVLTEELEPDRWQPLAQALKSVAIAKDFYIDRAVTADSARLLRIIGTVNPKGGNTVKGLINAPPVDATNLYTLLSKHVTSVVAATQTNQRNAQTPTSTLAQAMITQPEFAPADASVLVTKCAQIKWATENQGDVEEPFWYALLGVAAHTENPEQTAVEWSQNHPGYSYATTIKKMDQWRSVTSGPATCEKFKNERPSGCKGCKFADKVTTPVQLGTKFAEVAVSTDVLDKEAAQIPLPRPFKRTADGIKQVIEGTDVDICPFDIYPVGYGRDESLGYETVRYHWNRKHIGWQELTLRQAFLTDTRYKEFATTVADQGIVLRTQTQTESFQYMLRSYMDNLRHMRAMTNLYNTMGWKEDFTQFVIGNTLFRRNSDGSVSEEEISLSSSSQRLSSELYAKAGSSTDWTSFTKTLEVATLKPHMFALGVSLAAPLFAFTGLNGITISLYGPTGGGKTLAQYIQQSAWGDPQKLHFTAKFTPNSLYSRLGLYSNLPMTIDEATMVSDDEVGDFLYMVTQGRDKARLNRSAEERVTKTWALPVIVSTNKSWQSKLIASGLETDAQMARLLEVTVPPHPLFTQNSDVGRKMYQFVSANYGHIGREIVRYLLGLGADGVRKLIAEETATFATRYGVSFAGEERYWEQTAILADIALRICHEQGWIAFKPEPCIRWMLDQVGVLRASIAENQVDCFDLLAEYLSENASAAVTVMHTAKQRPVPDMQRIPRGELRIRFDMFRDTTAGGFPRGTLSLDRGHFRQWLSRRGADYKTFSDDMKKSGADVTPRSKKSYLGKDTPIKLGQVYVLCLNLNHDRLRGILDEVDQAATAAAAHLQVVS